MREPFVASIRLPQTWQSATSLSSETVLARAGEPHLRLDADLPCIPRHRPRPSQFSQCAERVVLLDVKPGLALRAQFKADPVDALDTHITAMNYRRLLR